MRMAQLLVLVGPLHHFLTGLFWRICPFAAIT